MALDKTGHGQPYRYGLDYKGALWMDQSADAYDGQQERKKRHTMTMGEHSKDSLCFQFP